MQIIYGLLYKLVCMSSQIGNYLLSREGCVIITHNPLSYDKWFVLGVFFQQQQVQPNKLKKKKKDNEKYGRLGRQKSCNLDRRSKFFFFRILRLGTAIRSFTTHSLGRFSVRNDNYSFYRYYSNLPGLKFKTILVDTMLPNKTFRSILAKKMLPLPSPWSIPRPSPKSVIESNTYKR